MSRPKVIVAGGGIGGCAVAAALHQGGYDVTVCERAPGEGRNGAILGLQSVAVLALRGLGAAEPVLAAGMPLETYELVSWSGKSLARWSPGDIGRRVGAHNIVVPWHAIVQALRGVLPEGALRLGATVTGYAADADGVTVRLSDGQELRGDLLVGADGLRSVVRSQMLGGTPNYAYTAWRGTADMMIDHLRDGRARHYVGPGRTCGTWPLADGRSHWAATFASPEPEHNSSSVTEGDLAHLRAMYADAPEPVRHLLAETPVNEVLRTPIYDWDPVAQWYDGRVVLLGDSVHAMQPTISQGALHALLDAVCLGRVLGQADLGDVVAVGSALKAYQDARSPVVRSAVAKARKISMMYHVTHPIGWRARDVILRATPEATWMRRFSPTSGELALVGHP